MIRRSSGLSRELLLPRVQLCVARASERGFPQRHHRPHRWSNEMGRLQIDPDSLSTNGSPAAGPKVQHCLGLLTVSGNQGLPCGSSRWRGSSSCWQKFLDQSLEARREPGQAVSCSRWEPKGWVPGSPPGPGPCHQTSGGIRRLTSLQEIPPILDCAVAVGTFMIKW